MDGFIGRFEHWKCVCRCALQIGALSNANNSYTPTLADHEVSVHYWRSLCVEVFFWMGS